MLYRSSIRTAPIQVLPYKAEICGDNRNGSFESAILSRSAAPSRHRGFYKKVRSAPKSHSMVKFARWTLTRDYTLQSKKAGPV
ncbi:hypothetical protein GWI33_021966 [Rhynchophorus ferrugineus]|uniref:Uncharacterized protein n=1 Tax=Rhynchophorus ferrugineus TaxID=354439 RepID=A0A834HMD7_RHYFE|nr:hypothetical protein GWI33_021966 [Rhynchophorus ferrugineus]